jgi:hypothetical protein
MLMKLTPGLNFINVLRTQLLCADRESVRFQLSCQYHFCAFGICMPKIQPPIAKVREKRNSKHSNFGTKILRLQT